MSASNWNRGYWCPPFVVGLEKMTGSMWRTRSRWTFGFVPGQSFWYDGPSQLKFSSSAWQCSKCPISSEYETFVVCADHVFPRASAVLYSAWNAYGADW